MPVPVLYLAPWVDLGGSDKGTIDWFRHLDSERFAPSLIATQPSDNRWLREIEPYAREVWALPDVMPGASFPRFVLGFVESRGIELVHIMNSRLGFDLLPDMSLLPRPPAVVVQLHAEEHDRSGYVRYVATRYADLVDRFSVTSRQLAEAMAAYDVPASRIEVIHTGVDAEEEFDPERVEPFPRAGDAPRVLWPGRLVAQKDPMLTLDVLALLRERGVRLTLEIVGDGELAPAVRARAAELGVAEMIRWHPPSQEMARWYASCDLLLMTSVFEGVPYVVYEALAMGLPVVAPALPGNVELMDSDSGALVAPRDDAAGYADAVERLLGDPEARARMGARSRARMRGRFSVREMAARHEALYDELLAGRREPARPAPPPARPDPLRLPRIPAPERSVAVIVPCFRHGRYLPECLASIRAQTLPAAQVIVVDDGSDDPETAAVLAELSGVELLRLDENRGPGAARNAALERVGASYVLPLDADDKLLPHALERMVGQLEAAGPEIGFVYPNRQHFGHRSDYEPSPAYNLHLLSLSNYCAAAALFDRRVFDAGARYAEDLRHGHEDWDLVLRLAERGVRGEPAHGKTFLYRKHGFSRVDATQHDAAAFRERMRERHPWLYADPAALKGRWAPALSIVAPAGTATPEQTCGDFELLAGGGADAVERALGRWVVVVEDPEVLARRNLVEQLLETLLANAELLALVLAEPPGGNGSALALMSDAEVGTARPVAVAWERSPERDDLAPALTGTTGTLVGDLVAALQDRGPVQWRNARGGRPAATRPAPAIAPAGTPRTVALARGASPDPAEALLQRRLALEPPALPTGGDPDAPWAPAETQVLCRHRRYDLRRVVTNSLRPPRGFAREHDLGLVHRYELPGTRALVVGGETLGWVEETQLPLLDALELRREPELGAEVLVAGDEDPLYASSEPIGHLGWIEALPIHPRRVPQRSSLWAVVPLWRTADRAAWRHDYAAGPARPPAAVALGSLWPAAGPGFVALERHGAGDLRSDLVAGPPPPRPAEAARWIAAPLRWTGRRPTAAALRAAGSRARHLTRGGGSTAAPVTLGWLRREPAHGWSPLFAARHPALPDTFVTRSELEARDLGYRVLGVLGHVCDLHADRDPAAQPHEVPWGSRFGHGRRYVEGPAG